MDLYLEYIKNTYNSILKTEITLYKSRQKIWIDISSKKIYKWPKAYEKMLNIIGHQGNINQNHCNIPLHIHWMAIIKKIISIGEVWGNWNPNTLLVGM